MAALSKAEYLKRYMSSGDLPKGDKEKKKRRKKPKPTKETNFRIIDDDVDFASLKRKQEKEEEEEEEKPTIAEVVDERPQHVREIEAYRQSGMWKTMGSDGEEEGGIDRLSYGVISEPGGGADPSKGQRSSVQRRRHDSSGSDPSPPRSGPSHKSQPRRRHDSDSDGDSKPRQKKKSSHSSKDHISAMVDSDSDHSPVRKGRHDSESDQSPPRRGGKASPAPQRRKRHDSGDSDVAPKRRRHDSDSDASPKHRGGKRNDSDSDLSPKRPSRLKAGSDSDQSPPRARKRMDSDNDQSPKRRKAAGSDSDQSPPRRRGKGSDSDQSPPRRRGGKGSDSDQSPPRRKQKKSRFERTETKPKHPEKAGKTLSGARAGLSSAQQMMEEAKKLRQKEEDRFNAIDAELLGKDATTVVRGRRKEKQMEKEEEAERRKKLEEKFNKWGKGLKQQSDRAALLEDAVHEASKPLARYSDDKDLDQRQREEERSEDPMLAFIQNKKKKEAAKKGGKKIKELPKYSGPTPPPINRYGLQPGFRWDGVDRSNGFEKKIFEHRANKQAVAQMAYKWSTEDM